MRVHPGYRERAVQADVDAVVSNSELADAVIGGIADWVCRVTCGQAGRGARCAVREGDGVG